MEEIKNLNEAMTALELLKSQNSKEIMILKESNSAYELERQEFINQIRTKNSEILAGEDEKQKIDLLSKQLDKINQEKLGFVKELEVYKRDNTKLQSQCGLYSESFYKVKNELDKLIVNFKIKTTECQEWKQKYEESDSQIGQMEQAIEDLQKESYSKTKQLSNIKDKEIRELEDNLRAQFEQEMRQYQEKISKLQNEINT